MLIRGGSCIVDPLGNVLAEPSFAGETIRLAELDRRIIARGKYDLDVVGHYARPDVFHLSVDMSPRPAVTSTGGSVGLAEKLETNSGAVPCSG